MKIILVKICMAIFVFVMARSVEGAFLAREERSLATEKNSSDFNSSAEIVVSVQLSFTDYTNKDVIPALNVTAPQGTTAFQLLNLAAQQNPCYLSQYINFPNLGHYITAICCVEQNITTNFYWFVYLNNILSPVGVDLIIPNNGDILKFEYRFINSTSGNHTESAPSGMKKGVQMISVYVELKFTNYPNPNVIPTQQITAPNGTSAFEFLGLAGQSNPCYLFQYETFSIGHYITTICCVEENKTTNFYWFIYINSQLSPVGADLLKPNNGDTLKFEYQSSSTLPTPTTIIQKTEPSPTNAMNKTTPISTNAKPTGKGMNKTTPISTNAKPTGKGMNKTRPIPTNGKPTGKGHKNLVPKVIIYFSLVIGVLGWKFN